MKINSSMQAAPPQFGWNPLKSIVTPLILLAGLASCSPRLNMDTYEPIHGQMTTMSDLLTDSEQAQLQAIFDRYDSSNPNHFRVNKKGHQKRAQRFFNLIAATVETARDRLLNAEGRSEGDLQALNAAVNSASLFTAQSYSDPNAAVSIYRTFDTSEQNDECHNGGTIMRVVGQLLEKPQPEDPYPLINKPMINDGGY